MSARPPPRMIERLRTAGQRGEEGFCLVRGAAAAAGPLASQDQGRGRRCLGRGAAGVVQRGRFTSYGKEQGFNAPTSEDAAFRYGAALNALLDAGRAEPAARSPTRLSLSGPMLPPWMRRWRSAAARAAEDVFGALFSDTPAAGKAPPTSSRPARLRRTAAGKVAAGAPLTTLDARACATACGSTCWRWRRTPRGCRCATGCRTTSRRFREGAGPAPRRPWRSSRRPGGDAGRPRCSACCVRTTALQEKFENIPPGSGRRGAARRPDRHALSAHLAGRRDHPAARRRRPRPRLARGRHQGLPQSASNQRRRPPVSLDPDNPSAAYQLGRLFAVLEAAQYAALGRVNASIADRYYGAASATPARVFGALLRGARNAHLRRAEARARASGSSRRLEEIMAHLPPEPAAHAAAGGPGPVRHRLLPRARASVRPRPRRSWRGHDANLNAGDH